MKSAMIFKVAGLALAICSCSPAPPPALNDGFGEEMTSKPDGMPFATLRPRGQSGLRSTCATTLCIRRGTLEPQSGKGTFYIFTRDGDDQGWSALLGEMNWWSHLDATNWEPYEPDDEDNIQICLEEGEQVLFAIHPDVGTDVFEIEVGICDGGNPTSFETLKIGPTAAYQIAAFPEPGVSTQGSDSSPCTSYYFTTTGDDTGEVIFYALMDDELLELDVPNDAGTLDWTNGPVIGIWRHGAHDEERATGGFTRCSNTNGDWAIGGTSDVHGVMFTRTDKWFYLSY